MLFETTPAILKAIEIEGEQSRPSEGIALWFLGGASLVLRSPRAICYLDLFTGPSPEPENLTKAIPNAIDPARLRQATLALSTHHDEDHCDHHALSRLYQNTSAQFVGPVSCHRLYQKWKFDPTRTQVVAPGTSFTVEDVTVRAFASNDAFDPDAVCYGLDMNSVSIFDAGDSLYFDGLIEIGQRYRPDIAFLNYAQNPPGKAYYMDEQAIIAAAHALNPGILFLKHYDLWKEFAVDPQPALEWLRAEGFDARVLKLGERFEYKRATGWQ